MTPAGFPHSDPPGSTLGCQLPRAYRRLLRPSSALDAKASTMCPSQLVTHTTNPTPALQNSHNWDQTRGAHPSHTSIPSDISTQWYSVSTVVTATKNNTHPPHNHEAGTQQQAH